MMMQMLVAGGLAPLADDKRPADESNPHGYFELEQVKRLRSDNSWLGKAEHRCIKVIHALLDCLPPTHEYHVIFMRRAIEEVMRSQQTMIERLGTQRPTASTVQLARTFDQQQNARLAWLEKQPNFRVHLVDYAQVIADPRGRAEKLAGFLLPEFELDVVAMINAVDANLYRQRTPGSD